MPASECKSEHDAAFAAEQAHSNCSAHECARDLSDWTPLSKCQCYGRILMGGINPDDPPTQQERATCFTRRVKSNFAWSETTTTDPPLLAPLLSLTRRPRPSDPAGLSCNTSEHRALVLRVSATSGLPRRTHKTGLPAGVAKLLKPHNDCAGMTHAPALAGAPTRKSDTTAASIRQASVAIAAWTKKGKVF